MAISDDNKLPLVVTLDELITASAGDKDWVMTLIDEAVLLPEIDEISDTSTLYFNSVQLTQVRVASRLRRDFDASPQAIGLILTLLDELRTLRQLQRQQRLRQDFFDID